MAPLSIENSLLLFVLKSFDNRSIFHRPDEYSPGIIATRKIFEGWIEIETHGHSVMTREGIHALAFAHIPDFDLPVDR